MGKNEMAGRRRKSAQPGSVPPDTAADGTSDGAFDIWLNRGLHQMYDDVAREPVPDELLSIIEADRARGEGGTRQTATDPALSPLTVRTDPKSGSPDR